MMNGQDKQKITFIGAGSMTRALVAGLIKADYPSFVTITNPSIEKLQSFQSQFGIRLLQDNRQAVEDVDIVVLCVKPNVLSYVCKELKSVLLTNRPLVVSVVAGASIDLLSSWLDPSLAIVRAMPNIPVAAAAGATGLWASENVSVLQADCVEALFRAVGVIVWANDEKEIDLITAVSGSGPAYSFFVMEAMQAAAQRMGLSVEFSRLLVLQTVLGASRMAMESGREIADLCASVVSPGGTTAAALKVLEEGKIKKIFDDAMRAALKRSQEISDFFQSKID